MRRIAEENMLLRDGSELPDGLKLPATEFHDGWKLAQAVVRAEWLERKIKARGWNLIKIADGSLRTGVGKTPREAIVSALKLALNRVSPHFNAAEVEHIELTEYPWFVLARVRVLPYRIQREEFLPLPDETLTAPDIPRQRGLPANAAALFPHFGSAMPRLKELLIASQNPQWRAQ